eukprot:gene4862-3483_t
MKACDKGCVRHGMERPHGLISTRVHAFRCCGTVLMYHHHPLHVYMTALILIRLIECSKDKSWN